MRHRLLIAVFCIIALCACQPDPRPPTPSAVPSTLEPSGPLQLEFDGLVNLPLDGVSIGLPKPTGWETLSTEHGVIVAERFSRLADHGVQTGLIASVFATPLSEFLDSGSADGQRAYDILTHVIETNPDDERRFSEVRSFMWNGYDAAYYLTSELESGPQMLIVGVTRPDEGLLLTGSVSAPRARAGQIRSAALVLLGGVTVNGEAFGADGLDVLPEPLVFPE